MVTKIQSSVSGEKVTAVAGSGAVGVAKRGGVSRASSPADAVEGGGNARLNTVAEAAAATGHNPFATLVASAVPVDAKTLRLAESSEATSEGCEPSLELMSFVSTLEAALAPRDNWSASRIRTGMMQTTYDAQEERAERIGVSRDDSEALAQYVLARPVRKDDKPVIHAHEWQAKVGTYFKGGDVNAFVQSVLRESYLLGTGELQIFADRLKSLNELRKKIRDEANRAREIKADMAKQAAGDPSWVAPFYYEPMTVDAAQDKLIIDRLSQHDIDEMGGQEQGDVGLKGDGAAQDASSAPARDFWADSGWLEGTQGSEIGSFARVKNDKLRNEPTTMEKIKAAIPHMNAADVEEYVLPILANFSKHGHEGGILELVEKMSPEQRLIVAAAGYGSDAPTFWKGAAGSTGKPSDQFTVAERAKYNALLEDAVNTLLPGRGGKLGAGVTTAQARTYLADYKQTLSRDATAKEANGSLAGIDDPGSVTRRDHFTSSTASAGGEVPATGAEGPRVGDAKRIDTVQGMEDYVKSLEDLMNSVGDDAQLANVDLQNCLQKQQQTMQMMSNISKMLHDVTMAIIRNMNA